MDHSALNDGLTLLALSVLVVWVLKRIKLPRSFRLLVRWNVSRSLCPSLVARRWQYPAIGRNWRSFPAFYDWPRIFIVEIDCHEKNGVWPR